MSRVEGTGHRLVGGTAAPEQGRNSTPLPGLLALGAHLGDPLPDLRHGDTPAHAYAATIKAAPANRPDTPHYRVRTDHVDRLGKIGLRRAGRMHHLGVGAAQAGSPVTILTDAATVTVIHQDTGEVLSNHTIDPDRSYWRNQHKPPGRWPVRYER
jgi:hypothetical protein